jgi:glycosyltransferase involved in cell wall biosynthesis
MLVDPGSVDAWREALARLLDDDQERRLLVAAGHRRAAGFTASESARALLDAYRLSLH